MQRTISFNKLFLIAILAVTVGCVYAQTNDEKSIQRDRVGVESADAMPLTLNEAIRLALENNNDIRTSRIDVEKAEYGLTASRGAYDPKIFSETYFERSSTPVASFLGGNSSGSLKQKDFTGADRSDAAVDAAADKPEPGETLRHPGAWRDAEGRRPRSSLSKLPGPPVLHRHPRRRQHLALPQAIELMRGDCNSVHACGKASRAAKNSKYVDYFANPINYSVRWFD